jgi:hypothetical protein
LAFIVSVNVFAQTRLQINDYPLGDNYTVLSKDSATSVFNKINSSAIFEFNYTRGGCDYRAHAMYLLLKKWGIKTFKIWNFASSKVFLSGKDWKTHNLLLVADDKINLSTKSTYYTSCDKGIEETVFWGYHVAPILLVNNKDKIDTMVIDPALFDKPVDYRTWISKQLQPKASSYFTFLEGNLISFETESQYQKKGISCKDCSGNNIMTGTFFTDDYSIQQKWIEQSLSKGKIFVEYYKNEIEPLEKQLQKFPTNLADLKVTKLACEIADKKQKIASETDLLNKSNVLKLPLDYQARYEKYVLSASQTLFGK